MSVAGGRCVWDEMAERGLALAQSVDIEGEGIPGKAGALLVPRLHLALGRNHIAPGEGRDGFVVGRKKMTFVRAEMPSGEGRGEAAVVAVQKRKCNDEGGLPAKGLLARKRPTLRNDHQQDLSNSFLDMVR